MPTKLSSAPSARTFAQAVRREILEPAAEKVAGADGKISASEARAAASALSGTSALAADAMAAFADTVGATPASREAFLAFAEARAADAAAAATGGDGRLSKADADALPTDLRTAFFALRGDALPVPADAPRLRYSANVLAGVLAKHGLSAADKDAVVAEAYARSDGNTYLNRAELEAAARALSTSLPALARGIPADWRAALGPALQADSFAALDGYLAEERAVHEVYPPPELTFAALEKTPLDNVKVVLLGQDPYHGEGEATGLSFSLPEDVRVPSSLRNIYKELDDDLGVPAPGHGSLEAWADQGVLLLNTALTVRKDEAGSHRGHGWEDLTSAMLEKVNEKDERVVFLLFGKDAQKKAALIDTSKHVVVMAAHPSGLSAHRGFFGSRPFSQANDALVAAGRDPIDWRIPD